MPQLFASLRRRRKSADASPPPVGLDLARFPGLDEALTAGDLAGARRILVSSDPALAAGELDRIELQLRNEAFRRQRGQYPPNQDWPPTAARVPDAVPDIPASDLDLETLVDGVRGRGAVIVRGLFPESACQSLRTAIDDAFTARDASGDSSHFHPLRDIRGGEVQPKFRSNWHFSAAEIPAPDVPGAARMALDQFQQQGVLDLVRGYLGERPALSLEKWTLRRVPPTTGTSWHQDGAFLGTHLHTLNLWVALSDCGRDASGLNLVGKRFDRIVDTGTPGAHFDWDVAPDVTERERGDDPILDPEFRAGDAVFFDQFLLHRTGVRPGMTKDRYALESWFFTPSSFPDNYEGLLV